jgi:ATP-dependent Clp protease ATP-binding subunit ClpC
VEHYVENPLSTKVLRGEFNEGDSIIVDLADDALTFTAKVAEAVAR